MNDAKQQAWSDEDIASARAVALERLLLANDFAIACAGYVASIESNIVALESAAVTDPSVVNVARAHAARVVRDDARRDLLEARAKLAGLEREFATVEGVAAEKKIIASA